MSGNATVRLSPLVQAARSGQIPLSSTSLIGEFRLSVSDTVEGSKGSEHIATHVERKSRFLMALKLSDKSATTMAAKTIACFQKIPKVARKTLTVDNGKEAA